MTFKHIGLGLVAALVIALPYLGILPGWTPALATVTAFMALSLIGLNLIFGVTGMLALGQADERSEERRVGKECGYQCRSRWSPYH